MFRSRRGGLGTNQGGGNMQKEVVVEGGHRFVIDTTGQNFALDSSEETDSGPLKHSLMDLLHGANVVPMSVLGMKAKQFDDGLYAAIELLAQNGAGKFTGKVKLLGQLLQVLHGGPTGACDVIGAAGALGRWLNVSTLSEDARHMAEQFASSPLAKPISFYTWSENLQAIFAQDRFLQRQLERADANALVAAIGSHGALQSAYCQYLQLMSKMTNRMRGQSLAERLLHSAQYDPSLPECFFPASGSKEDDLLDKSDLGRPGFSLMDDFIAAVRNRKIDLRPTSSSGWYEYCQYALEPLLVPERCPEWKMVKTSDRYRRFAEGIFRAFNALTRETHAKQFSPAAYGCAPYPISIDIKPELRVEPLPSMYLRRAESYLFIRSVLMELFGEQGLKDAYRLTAGGAMQMPLLEELSQIEQLFFGAYLVACADLDLPRFDQHDLNAQACEQQFFDFARNMTTDADLSQSAIMMLPIYRDIRTGLTKVWVFLGWRRHGVMFSWATQPAIISRNINESWKLPFANYHAQLPEPRVSFGGTYFPVAVPVLHEIWVKDILNRAEMREVCRAHSYIEGAILNHLDVKRESASQPAPRTVMGGPPLEGKPRLWGDDDSF